MPNYVRWREAGATYFFTLVTHRRRPLFRDDVARRTLSRAFVAARQRWPFDMPACVLLPDHLLCIWSLPDDDDDFPVRWANVKRLFTQNYLANGGRALPVSPSRVRHNERGIWQPRYWEHRIRDEDELRAYRDYIHINPVKHGLVEQPTAWPWSSVHRYIRLGWLDANWFGPPDVKLSGAVEPD